MTDLPIYPLTEEHKMLRDAARDFAQKEIVPIAAEYDETGEFPHATIKKMGELGFMGIEIPERYGGAGMDALAYVLALEEISKADASHGVVMSVNNSLYCHGILKFGTEEQKKKFLTPIASGKSVGAYSLTEPQSGSDAGTMKSRAARDGDSYVLNGRKSWVTSGPVADYFVVFMMSDPAKKQKGVSAFLVPGNTPGLTRGKKEPKLGIRASATCELTFEDCRIPAENRLGEEGEGFKIAMSCLDNGRFTVAAGATGLIRACLEDSIKYAMERETFGKPIAQHQLVKQKIAFMRQWYDSASLLVWRAGWLKNQGVRNTRETSMAKWYATDHSVKAALEAIQVHGAYGFSDEYPVERYLRNSKGAVIYEGTSEIHQLMQADYAFGFREDKPLRCEMPAYDVEYFQGE